MDTELEKNEFRNLIEFQSRAIKQIVLQAFKKAKEESLEVTKTALAKHISAVIEDNYKEYISVRTFVRYYDEFISEKGSVKRKRDRKILDLLCKYIGFDGFVDFCKECDLKDNKEKTEITKKVYIGSHVRILIKKK